MRFTLVVVHELAQPLGERSQMLSWGFQVEIDAVDHGIAKGSVFRVLGLGAKGSPEFGRGFGGFGCRGEAAFVVGCAAD